MTEPEQSTDEPGLGSERFWKSPNTLDAETPLGQPEPPADEPTADPPPESGERRDPAVDPGAHTRREPEVGG